MHAHSTKFITENITEYIAHVQTVCTRPLLGGEGPGDEAKLMQSHSLHM